MKSAIALLTKVVAIFIAAWISFSLLNNIFLTLIFMITGLVTALNYLVGDLLILPRFGNIAASITNGVLAAVISYAVLIFSNYTATASIWIFALIVTAFEFFYHMYLLKSNIVKKDSGSIYDEQKINYSTETAKEIHPYGDIWKPSNKSDDHNQ